MKSSIITPTLLKSQLSSEAPPVLLHLLSDEAFEEARISGSKHACIYEVAFLDVVSELVNDTSANIIVYGMNDKFGASGLAFEGLQGAGYENVQMLEGGLDAWVSSGFSVEGRGRDPLKAIDGSYAIDLDHSVFRWTGRNLFNQHHGRIAFQSGKLEIQDGHLASGDVILDMTRITCTDIQDGSVAAMLIGHLATDDFFSVQEFSIAKFRMESCEAIAESAPGDFNLVIKGWLKLRGKTEAVEFNAQIAYLGGKLGLQGQFDVDRTRFGSVYGSGKIFEKLGQHVVNDKISVSFQLICQI
jgi:polyisoprenoid-binding protein YceI